MIKDKSLDIVNENKIYYKTSRKIFCLFNTNLYTI